MQEQDTLEARGVVPFAMVPVWAISAPISGNAFRLFCLLVSRTSADSPVPFPSNRWMSERLDCTDRAIQLWKAELVKAGMVEAVPTFHDGRQTSSRYLLNMDGRHEPSFVGEGERLFTAGMNGCSSRDIEPSIYIQKERKEGSNSQTKANFDAFWLAYPTRHGPNPKKTAETSFKRLNLQDQAAAIQGAHALGREFSNRDDRQFIPMASTYLNQRRWECQQPSQKPAPSKPAPKECPEW